MPFSTFDPDRLSRALSAAEIVGAWEWDIPADRIVADPQFARMFGMSEEQGAAGLPIRAYEETFHPDDRERVTAAINAAITSGEPFECEYRIRDGDGWRWILARGQAEMSDDGRALRFPGVAVDITRRKEAENALARTGSALAESESRFRALADTMPQMVWATQPDGLHDYYNARWYEFTGAPAGSTDGEGWNDMFHPEDQDRAWTRWQHSLETGEPYEIEYRLRRADGVYRWTLGRALPVRDPEGRIIRWFGTCTDIDDLKQAQAAREVLSQELSHRIKNIFAVVSALVALSGRQHPEAREFAKSLRTRIQALARAHEFVRPHTAASAPSIAGSTLQAFLRDLLAAYQDDDGGNVVIEGENAIFDDQAATPVALLFHELATNAAKYGALSVPGGQVTITSAFEGDRFRLTWRETGGPCVEQEPSGTGFGFTLSQLAVEGQLGGRLERQWLPEGLILTADLPVTALSRRRHAPT